MQARLTDFYMVTALTFNELNLRTKCYGEVLAFFIIFL